jgi:two-component system chemotaxis sensor kinase CheA
MTASQLYQLIWEPGLTTAKQVTEVSGRGMGMDIVKSKIEEINGVVDLESEPGKGTTLTIKLPLTLAILPSLMVDIGGDTFAMPLESVIEIVSLGKEHLATVCGQKTARVRDRVISLVEFDQVFRFDSRHLSCSRKSTDETTLVVVGEQDREIGLAVDRVLGEQDIVIKSMAENFRNVAGIAGASILGDGRVSLILDVVTLIDMSCQTASSSTTALEDFS